MPSRCLIGEGNSFEQNKPIGAIVRDAAELARSRGLVGTRAGLGRAAVDLGFGADEIAAAVAVGSAAITRRGARGGEQQAARDQGDRAGGEEATRPPHRYPSSISTTLRPAA